MPVAHYHGIRGFLVPRGYGVEGAEQMAGWRVSPNLALDQRGAERRADGASIVHLGFGETRLPGFEPLVRRLPAGAGRTSYGPGAGAAPGPGGPPRGFSRPPGAAQPAPRRL